MVDCLRDNRIAAQALVIGNATVDEIYAVPCLPKPGESVLGHRQLRDVGGKGANVATILSRCGIDTQLLAVVGNDEQGEFIRRELSGESLHSDLLVSVAQPSDVSLVYSDPQGRNTIVTTVDAAHSLEHSSVHNALGRLRKHDMLVLQANLTESLTRIVIDQAKRMGLQIVFNPSPYAPWIDSLLKDVDVIFVNTEEARHLTGADGQSAVTALLEMGPRNVVLTRGKDGAILGQCRTTDVNSHCQIVRVPAVATTVVDTTGAGDTYLAVTMASTMMRGTCLDDAALSHGACAAAITINSLGVRSAFPTANALLDILSG